MPWLSATAMTLAAQVDDARLTEVCRAGEGTNPVCATVLRLTDSSLLARLAGAVVPPVVEIVLIAVLAYVANRLVRRFIKRSVRGMTHKGIARLGALRQKGLLADTGPLDMARAEMRTETIGGVLRSVATFTIWILALFMMLGAVNVQLGPLIAGAGIAGIALGFGAQNLVKDFLSGIFMLVEDQYGIGDIVDVGEASGTVEGISLRSTRLRDVDGTVWHVPNGEIRRVGNKSQQWSRALLDVGVAYDTDIPTAVSVLERVANDLREDPEWGPQILEQPEVWGVERFDADQITIRMVIQTQPLRQFAVNRELRARIKAAFDQAGIEIPLPQRTVWLRHDERADADSGDGRRARARPEGSGQAS
ncbi:MAG TPA: mechanosensitive ion channel family protein [Egibacteraceae bacterium]|nr:mechanosensitive ion channel family protein [Actinomycetota bacterium]HWB70939.1 mechanosensitive ion channel family protein [Egibacteraceae bacterium]